jgi:pimeloyl-[acyl-carrier protein] methyl ester esterase
MSKIATEIYGAGKPLVLIHGWAMHSGIWRDFAQQLSMYFQVICIDLPGHGRSERGPLTLQYCRDEIIKVVPQQPCCWLGWSMGVPITLDIANNFPQQVEALVLMAGNPRFIKTGEWPGIQPGLLEAFAENLQTDSEVALIRFVAMQVQGLPDAGTKLRQLKKLLFEYDFPSTETLLMGLELLKTADLRPEFAALKWPVMAIMGPNDPLVPDQTGAAMQQLLPQLKLHTIETAGHLPFLSHEQEVIQQIVRFLELYKQAQ